jgi:predicted transcriptional regulator
LTFTIRTHAMEQKRKIKYHLSDDMAAKLERLSERHQETPMELLRLAIQAMYLSMPKKHQEKVK